MTPESEYSSEFCKELAKGARIMASFAAFFIGVSALLFTFCEPVSPYGLIVYDVVLAAGMTWSLVESRRYDRMAAEALVREVLES